MALNEKTVSYKIGGKMLQAISRTNPHTIDDVKAAFDAGGNGIAKCHESGARVYKSRTKYVLILEEPPTTRYWNLSEVLSDQDAIERASTFLATVLNGSARRLFYAPLAAYIIEKEERKSTMPATPEFFKKMITVGVREFETLRSQEENPMEAYHHATYELSALLCILSEQTGDVEVVDAIGEIIESYEEIAEHAGVDFSPYEEYEE